MADHLHHEVFEIRDAVHGFVKLTAAELRIVNCPTYQRLRDIRQLAMAHMVYPGATHTRFEHSLGCLHLASTVFDSIKRRVGQDRQPDFEQAFNASATSVERGRRLLRLASLLHDVGHGPFSHTGESLMPRDKIRGKRRAVNHEDMTERLIRETEIAETIAQCFGTEEITVDDVVAVATNPAHGRSRDGLTRSWYEFLYNILAGELGVDRMDYLLRDAHHSGQETGKFDYRKLIDSMAIVPPVPETHSAYRLGVDGGGWLIAEQMVAARYLMYLSLYFHKTKRSYERHIEEFLKAWLPGKFGKAFLPTNDVRKYARLTDSVVLGDLYSAASDPKSRLHELALPFLKRNHLRLVKELVLADNFTLEPGSGRRIPDENRLDKIERGVRMKFGNRVWLDKLSHSAAKFLGNPGSIPVWLDGRTRDLEELSELIRGMPTKIWRARFYSSEDDRASVGEYIEQALQNQSQGKRRSVTR